MTHLSDYDFDARSLETALSEFDESRTVQSQTEDSDINVLVRRFGLTGTMPAGLRVPQYEDFTEVFDFQSAMHAVMRAQESFNAMPAEVRNRFANDPQAFLSFCEDRNNLDELRKLGLAVPAVEDKKNEGPSTEGPGGA